VPSLIKPLTPSLVSNACFLCPRKTCGATRKSSVTPWDPSLLLSASQLLWERGDIVPGLYPILV
jgi:hypothetical protein